MTPKKLTIALILIIAIAGLTALKPVEQTVHGIIQIILGGNSLGKTFLVFGFFIFSMFISLALLKIRIFEKANMFLNKHGKKFLCIFIFFAAFGLVLGAVQFSLLSEEFNSSGPFATYLQEGNYINWEASGIYHNHFPKTTIYFLKQFLPISLEKTDDGQPWFKAVPNPEAWSAIYLIAVLLVFFGGIAYLNSKIKRISISNYLIFLLGVAGTIISIIDGGITSTYFLVPLWAIAYFITKYEIMPSKKEYLFLIPLMFVSAYFFFLTQAITPFFLNNLESFYMLLLFASGTYILEARKSIRYELSKIKLLKFNVKRLFTIGVILLFLYSLTVNSFLVADKALGILTEKGQENGFYVYGLPRETAKEEVRAELEEFGEILVLEKEGWLAYAKIKAGKNFRGKEIENKLIEKFQPESYLFAETLKPMHGTFNFKIIWSNGFPGEKENFFGKKILDLNVLDVDWKEDEFKESIITVSGESHYNWQMLSILTAVKEKGYSEQVIVTSDY